MSKKDSIQKDNFSEDLDRTLKVMKTGCEIIKVNDPYNKSRIDQCNNVVKKIQEGKKQYEWWKDRKDTNVLTMRNTL